MKTIKVVLVRHGQSQWNLENRFTGWEDVDLTKQGEEESKNAAKILKKNNFTFDVCYTSILKRATRTTDIILKEMKLKIPVIKDWRLNERCYGGLTGLNKDETRKKFGEEQVHIWRRSFNIRPPEMDKKSKYYPGNQKVFSAVPRDKIPTTESLRDTIDRVIPYWKQEIEPAIKSGKKVLISAHGNSIRGIIKHLGKISDEEIPNLEIPLGKPIVYELDEKMREIRHYYLGIGKPQH